MVMKVISNHNQELTKLDISHIAIGDEGIEYLCDLVSKGLVKGRNLRHLFISFTKG